MAKTSLEVFESEVKRLTTGKAGVQFGIKDESRRLKDGASSRGRLRAVA